LVITLAKSIKLAGYSSCKAEVTDFSKKRPESSDVSTIGLPITNIVRNPVDGKPLDGPAVLLPILR